MKTFLNKLLVMIYISCSLMIMMTAIVYPFVLAAKNSPPWWTCFILYPITLIIMASQQKALKWADTIMND